MASSSIKCYGYSAGDSISFTSYTSQCSGRVTNSKTSVLCHINIGRPILASNVELTVTNANFFGDGGGSGTVQSPTAEIYGVNKEIGLIEFTLPLPSAATNAGSIKVVEFAGTMTVS